MALRRWRPRVALLACALAAAGLAEGSRWVVHADLEPITDLPFIGSFPLTCGWHINCAHDGSRPHGNPPHTDLHGFNPAFGGIDIGMAEGTNVYAAGHGTVTFGGDRGDGFGRVVDIDHTGERSKSAHLRYFFFRGGERVCRAVATGYSGRTGNVTGPHLHFQGEHTPHFTPIHGQRPNTISDADLNFDPFSGAPRPNLDHPDVVTRAYTVDDTQLRSGEFALFARGGAFHGWVRHRGNGFGYDGQGTATFWTSVQGNTPPFDHAQWHPNLNEAQADTWDIYMFIPDGDGNSERTQASFSNVVVKYTVRWLDGGSPRTHDFFIDQSGFENDWVRLEDGVVSNFHIDAGARPLIELAARCPNCPASGRPVAADAALFVPQDCEP